MNQPPDSPILPRKRRWLPRFALRTLLITMSILGVGLAYVGNLLHRVRHQWQVVAKIENAGGKVNYNWQFGLGADLDFELNRHGYHPGSTSFDETPDGRRKRTRTTSAGKTVDIETPPGPWLIRRMLGDDVFARVEAVHFFDFEPHPAKTFDPQLFLELPELKAVTLVDSQVNDECLDCLAQVPPLRILDLYGGSQVTATETGVARLQSAKELESLDLQGEWVRDETIAGIASLRQLRSLSILEVPNATSALFSHLDDLTELRKLMIIRAKQVDDQHSETLRRLKNLRELWILETPISDATLSHLTALSQLEFIDLSATNVGDSGMEHLAGLPNLKYLRLVSTKVSDAGLPAVARLSQLRHLDLSNTKITDAGLPAIARLSQLEQLHLSETSVTDDGLLHLQSLKSLKKLTVKPHVTIEGAERLRKALPRCTIYN